MNEITPAQLEQALNSAAAHIDEHLAPVIKATAMKVADTQRALVRKRSGRTEKSIRASGPDGAPFGSRTIEAEIGPTYYVGRLLELGTAHSPPFPFVAESLDPHLDQHRRDVAAAATTGALKKLTT